MIVHPLRWLPGYLLSFVILPATLCAGPDPIETVGKPFDPAQHEALARRTFAAAYAAGVYVGQLRTQLGLPGAESAGPRAAAEALLERIAGGATPAA